MRDLPTLDLPSLARVEYCAYKLEVSATRWADTGAELLLKFGSTLRGATWVRLDEVTYQGRPVELRTQSEDETRLARSIIRDEQRWADQRIARRLDATMHPRR